MNVTTFVQTIVSGALEQYRKYSSSKDYFYYERYKHLGGVRQRIAKKHGLTQGKILDLGTGDGFFAMALAEKLRSGGIVGIDRVEQWAKEARENILTEGLSRKCVFSAIDFWENEFPDNSFDMIATFLAICNLARTEEELDRACAEFRRILKPGGTILLAEATPEDSESKSEKLGFAINKALGYHYFPKKTIIKMLAKHNLNSCEVYYHKTRSIAFGPEELEGYLRDEVDMGEIDNTIDIGWKKLYRKYYKKVLKTKVEFDSKITVIVSKKE